VATPDFINAATFAVQNASRDHATSMTLMTLVVTHLRDTKGADRSTDEND